MLCYSRTFFSPGTSVMRFMNMYPILSLLQLMVPDKTEYPRPCYISSWTNEFVKHFKLIVLSFSCLIIIYARPQGSFHWNQDIRACILFRRLAALWFIYEDSRRLRDSRSCIESATGTLVAEGHYAEDTAGHGTAKQP